MRHQGNASISHVRCRNTGDFGVDTGSGDFHDIGAHNVKTTQTANDFRQLSRGQPGRFQCVDARCMGGVECRWRYTKRVYLHAGAA